MKKWLDRYAEGGPNLEDMKANFLQQYRPSLQADNTRLGSQRANVTNDQAQQLQKDAIRNAQRAAEERARLANARQTMDNESIPFTFPTGEKKKWADMDFRERNYVRGQSLRTKGRINEEGKETLLDYVNPLNWYGNMAANAAEAPYIAKQTNSVMPYVTAAVEPLVVGRMMGSGTMNPFSKKFYTNSISDANFINHVGLGIPKAGINLASRLPLENIPIVNQAYKYNPWRFTANPEAYYHRSPDLKNVVNKETGMLQGFGESEAGKLYNQSAVPGQGPQVVKNEGLPNEYVSRLNIKKPANNELYFSKGTPLDYGRTNMILDETTGKLVPGQGYQGPYIVEATNVPFVSKANGKFGKVFDNETGKFVRGKLPPTGIGKYAVSKRPISADEVKFYKENWLQGYRPVNVNTESSVLPILNVDATSSNFENTKLGKALIGTSNLSTEFLGELLNGRRNRKGIKEGNEWLQNWIDDPATQAKIKNDMEEAVYKDFVTNTPANRQEAFLNLIENQSRNYKVNTKEYSLLQQLKDNIAQYRDINAREPIHLDNSGVSYEHAESPFYRDYVEKGGKPNKRYGNWISRAHFSNKANTTVHEGTHGWTSRNALEDSGLRDMSLENTNPEIKNDFYEWERLRNEGKSLKEIEKIMGKDRAFQAYIADPTEMHARTMELRKHFGIKPNEKFDVNDATKKLNKLSSLLKGNFKQPITGLKEYMNVIDNDPQKFANLLNKFWGVVPAGMTIGALNNSSGPANQYENGGYTTDYNFPAWQLADPIRASYHVVNPERFHGPDTYKYPNHMTFSNESMYSTPEHMGGTWTELKNGKWQFEPSQWNIQNAGGKENFLNLWKQTEGKQGNKLKFAKGGQTYTIQPGDNLSSVAQKYGVSLRRLVDANSIVNPDFIKANQTLIIPNALSEKPESVYQDWESIKNKQNRINAIAGTSDYSPDEQIINQYYNNRPEDTYLVVDKKRARMNLYKGNKLQKSYEVGTGVNPGDAQTVTRVKDINNDGIINASDKLNNQYVTDWEGGNKSTGAGVYRISHIDPKSKEYYNVPSFNLVNDQGVEVATSIHGTPIGRRVNFNDNNVFNNRMSNGCINGKCYDLEDLYKKIDVGSNVYILPEDEGNKFQLVDGKPVLRVDSKNRSKYNSYTDQLGNVRKGQGINQSVNTLNYKPIKGLFNKKDFVNNVYQWNDFNDENEYQRTTKPFYNALVNNKKRIMKEAKIPSDVYNEIARMSFGIYGTESNFGDTHTAAGNFLRAVNKSISPSSSSSPDYKAKYSIYGADEDTRSVGLTQLRWSYLNDDEKKVLKNLGITSNKDFLDPEKAAIGTTAVLGMRYNQQLTADQKKDLWKYLPTKWNKRSNYSDRVKNNSKYLTFQQLDEKKNGGQIHNWREVEVPHKKNQLSGWLDKL